MDLLERYIRQIERYLPLKERKETIKELRSLILDQVDGLVHSGLSEEQALYNVIVEMGEPREVASKYYDARPFISKEMEPILMLVLKIVSITLPLVILFANSLEYIFSTESINIMDFLLNLVYTIPSALYSLLVGYGFIFMFFYLIERFIQPKFEVEQREFNPNLLPKVPAKVYKVSLFESTLTILATCLAIYLFNLNQGLIAIYVDGDRLPLLDENFDKILPFINMGWISSIILHIFYLFKRSKNLGTKTIELTLTIYGGAMAILLATSNIFNDATIEGISLNFIPNTFKIVMIIVGIATIIGGIVEYVKLLINLDALEELQQEQNKK